MTTLSTRARNGLADAMQCKPSEVTALRVAQILRAWMQISRAHGIGIRTQRDIRQWMEAEGYTYSSRDGWLDRAGEEVPIPEDVPVAATEYNGILELRLPPETLAGVQRISELAGESAETIIRVILAIEMTRQQLNAQRRGCSDGK